MSFLVFEGLGYCLGGFIVAFYQQWEVALITLGTVPLLVVPAMVMLWSMTSGVKVAAT